MALEPPEAELLLLAGAAPLDPDAPPLWDAPPPSDAPPPPDLDAPPPPELTRLLGELGRVLGPDGLSAPLGEELRQAQQALGRQCGAWLRWESLWRGLQELRRDPSSPLPPQVLQALDRALLSAHLRRPPPPPPLPRQDPSPLRQHILPALERHLRQKVSELDDYHSGGRGGGAPRGGGASGDGGNSGDSGDTSARVAADALRLRRARCHRRHLRLLLHRQRRLYPQVLGRCAQLLRRLAGEGTALRQEQLQRQRAQYLQLKGTSLLAKIRLEELQVLLDTYTPGKLEAHRRIRAALEAELARLSGEAEFVRSALAAFEALGPAVAAQAEEYRRLRERLEQQRWALHQLRSAQHGPDRAGTPP